VAADLQQARERFDEVSDGGHATMFFGHIFERFCIGK
jgi:tRNA U34 5-carboxymethylaminomethyl modifying GTPase MnmE/TrmE